MSEAYSVYSFSGQPKVHINLPHLSWKVLEDDIIDFTNCDKVTGYSNFVNRIVTNYINSKRFPAVLDNEMKINIKEIKSLKDIILKKFNPPKECAMKIDLSKQCKLSVAAIGRQVNGVNPPITEIFTSTGQYIRAILLDYTGQRYDVRCQIYNYDNYKEIQDGLKEKKSLIVTTSNKQCTMIIPYGLISDSYHVHSYLVGLYTDKRKPNEVPQPDDIALLRFSYIENVQTGKTDSLTSEEKKAIKESISQKKVSYIKGTSQQYKVKLTENGEKLYKKIVFQRPNHLPRTEEDKQQKIYRFDCTEFQIKNYFRRFGADAVIISPKSVHDKMLEEYKRAFEKYSSL